MLECLDSCHTMRFVTLGFWLLVTACSLGGIVDVGTPSATRAKPKTLAADQCKEIALKTTTTTKPGDNADSKQGTRYYFAAKDGSSMEVDEATFRKYPVSYPLCSEKWRAAPQ